jgi:hypothetical protein
MQARAFHFHWVATFCLGFLLAARLGAQDADSSPFLPAAGPGAPGAAAENEPLELHGIMSTQDGLRVCIYNVATKTSKWVGLNEGGMDNHFVVKSADPDRDTVSVLSDGRVLTLSLRKAKVDSFNGGYSNGGLPPGVSVVLNPTAADEQRRLQAIADEVRRRRLAREQNDRLMDQSGGRLNNR